MKYDIFISYSRVDLTVVKGFADKFSQMGYKYWMDVDGIETGDEFKRKIVSAIKESKVFLFFSSEASNSSPWTVKEVNVAVLLKKHIIPIKLDNAVYDDSLLLDLAGLDFIECCGDNRRVSGIQKLMRSLKNKIDLGNNMPGGLTDEKDDIAQYSTKDIEEVISLIGDKNEKEETRKEKSVDNESLRSTPLDDIADKGETAIPNARKKLQTNCGAPFNKKYLTFIAVAIIAIIVVISGVKLCCNQSVNSILIPVYDDINGKWGYANEMGNEVIECKYDNVEPFFEGLARVCMDGKYGFIDDIGNEVIECKYDNVEPSFSDGLAQVCVDDKYGFIDRSGNEVIECKYDHTIEFFDGFARVYKDGKAGVIDKSGNEVIECKYSNVQHLFSEGLSWVCKGRGEGKFGFVDMTGNEVIECKYIDVEPFSDGLALVENSSYKHFYIDKTGNEVIECKYECPCSFSEGLAQVIKNGRYGFIDKSGNEVIECKYDNVEPFFEGLAPVCIDGKYGFIDKSGNEVIECKYDYVDYKFSEGLVEVAKNDKCGFVNKTGNEIIECKYDQAWHFSGGLARVKKDGKSFYIDKAGKEYINR